LILFKTNYLIQPFFVSLVSFKNEEDVREFKFLSFYIFLLLL